MTERDLDPRMTAYALGELGPEVQQQLEAEIANDEAAMAEILEIDSVAKLLERELSGATGLALSAAQREELERAMRLGGGRRRNWGAIAAAAAGVCAVGFGLFMIARPYRNPHDSPVATSVEYRGDEYEPEYEYDAPAPAMEPPPAVMVAPDARLRRYLPAPSAAQPPAAPDALPPSEYGERYDRFPENPFVDVADDPRSTFSIDVDTASYALVRRFLRSGTLPPRDAVRIEELVNYFRYAYPEPAGAEPVSLSAEVREAPWAPGHRLLRVGLKGRHIASARRPTSNLVFLIDVSGSMDADNKLPLLKRAIMHLVGELDRRDRISIVAYAGESGVVLRPTSGGRKPEILSALNRLEAAGSTNGGAGIEQAYAMAASQFVEGGVNRVILATDGDFNVGVTSQQELIELIQDKARTGVFLSVLGFGDGNYKDATMEQLADMGNGNYAYIDNLDEARKVLVEQMAGTLVTVAKDVKIQLEFNPAEVSAFRLIGYENRALAHRDFNDDGKDAGEIGADHTVTAFYELVPAGATPGVDPLKYQRPAAPRPDTGSFPGELLTIKLRYKAADASESRAIELAVRDEGLGLGSASPDFRFGAAVAGFGMLLRESPHRGNVSYGQVLELARSGRGNGRDREAREEFIELVRSARARLGGE